MIDEWSTSAVKWSKSGLKWPEIKVGKNILISQIHYTVKSRLSKLFGHYPFSSRKNCVKNPVKMKGNLHHTAKSKQSFTIFFRLFAYVKFDFYPITSPNVQNCQNGK